MAHSVAAVLYSQFTLYVMLFRTFIMLCTFTSALSPACVQCPIWLLSAVPWCRAFLICCGPGSSVGIATGYGLDGLRVESRWGGEIFRTCPDRPWGPPSLCTMGTGSFPGVKSGRGLTLTPHLLLVPRSRKSYTSTSLMDLRPVQSLSACTRVHFTFTFISYVAQVLSEWFWVDSTFSHYYWYHFCFYIPLIIILIIMIVLFLWYLTLCTGFDIICSCSCARILPSNCQKWFADETDIFWTPPVCFWNISSLSLELTAWRVEVFVPLLHYERLLS